MKNFLIFSFILVSFIASCQDYTPFDFENGEWFCRYSIKGGITGQHGTYYAVDSLRFYCDGDTVINNIRFHKIYYNGYTESQIVERTFITDYLGAIRNDTLEKRVYFRDARAGEDLGGTGTVLYDFNLKSGDSIQTGCWSGDREPVVKIDSVYFCGHYHKRYNTASGYWVAEGIGSKYGLFEVHCATNVGWFYCYHEKDNLDCDFCRAVTAVQPTPEKALKIFPNPCHGNLKIMPQEELLYIEVFSPAGVRTQIIRNNFGNIGLKQNGCYFLKIHTRSGLQVRKVVNISNESMPF